MKNAWIHFGAGMLYMKNSQIEKAEKQFKKCMAMDPFFTDALLELGEIKRVQRKVQTARRFFNRVITIDAGNEAALHKLALLDLEEGEYDKAEDRILRVFKLNPTNFEAMLNMALVLGRKGNFEHAETLIEEAYRNNKNLIDGFARLGWIYVEAANWLSVHDIMIRDFECGRMSSAWKCNLAIAKAQINCWDKAFWLVEDAYKKDPSICDGYAKLGLVGLLNGKGTDFLNDQIEKEIQLNRISDIGRYSKAVYLLVARDMVEEAVCEVEILYSEKKHHKNFLSGLGWLCIRKGQIELGCQLMERDYITGRMNQQWKLTYAAGLNAGNMPMKALYVMREVLAFRRSYDVIIIGFDIRPDAVMSMSQFAELISEDKDIGDLLYNDPIFDVYGSLLTPS